MFRVTAKTSEMNDNEHHNSHSTRIWYPRLQISRKNKMFEMNSNSVLISSPIRQKQSLSFETTNLCWLKRSWALRQSNQRIQYADQQSDQVSSSSVPDIEGAPQFKVPYPPSPPTSHQVSRPKLKMKHQCYSVPSSEVSRLFDLSEDDARYAVSESQGSESDKFLIIRRPDFHADAAECFGAEDNLGECRVFLIP